MSDKIVVKVRSKTVPASYFPPITGKSAFTGMDTSRHRNKNLINQYPELKAFIESNLQPYMLENRKTLSPMLPVGQTGSTDHCYIIPALNKNTQNTHVKYIFGRAKDKQVPPVSPWTRVGDTKWYVIDASAQGIWPISRRNTILTGVEGIFSGYFREDYLTANPDCAAILEMCNDLLYFQYHLYSGNRAIGRVYKYMV